MKKIILSLAVFICCTVFAQEHYLLIGTYTGGKSEGIYVYKFNSTTGDNSLVSVAKSSNPSFLTVSASNKFVYAVNEDADSTIVPIGGTVTAFSFNNGTLTPINKQPSGGNHPCYISIDKTSKWIFTGNYSSATVGVLPVNEDGSLKTLQQIIQHKGSGPNEQRQKAAHVHAAVLSANDKHLYVPDLGMDKVMVYAFNKNKGTLKLKSSAAAAPGIGPRHFTLNATNTFAYLMEELTGTVVCYKVKKGKLQFKQRISALPEDFKVAIGSADIHISPDDKFLYCSNRGDANTISIFAVHPTDGKLTLIGEQSTLGKTPRNFNFDPSGNFLLVANQNSDEIVIFKVNKATGLLSDTGKRISVGNPVCIKWVE